jgi:ribonuclease J
VALGRSVQTHARVAHATGYLDWPGDITWPPERARELPRDRLLGIATGTQAEARAALAKLAHDEHQAIDLLAGDTVVLSSRVIPGHEPEVYALMGDLLRKGVHLRSWISDRGVHVSGHAHSAEQRRMIELVRPKSFVPVHGTLHHLHRHAELARGCGVGEVTILEDGDVGVLGAHGLRKDGHVQTGRVHVWAGRALPPSVLKDRLAIAQAGVAMVVVVLNGRGALVGDVTIDTRGVLDAGVTPGVITGSQREAREAIAALPPPAPGSSLDEIAITETVRFAVRRSFGRALGFKPVTVVQVVRVAG